MHRWATFATRRCSRLVNDHPRIWTRSERERLHESLHEALRDLPKGRQQVIDVSFDQIPLQRQLELLIENPPPDAHCDPIVLQLLNGVQNERWTQHPRVLHAAGKLVLSLQLPEVQSYANRVYEATLPHLRLLSVAEKHNVFLHVPPRLLHNGLDIWAQQIHTEDEIVAFCQVLGARKAVPSTFTFENVVWSTYSRESLLEIFLNLARAKLYDITVFSALVDQILLRYRYMPHHQKEQTLLTLGLYKQLFDAATVFPHPLYLAETKHLKQKLVTDIHASLPMLTVSDAVRPLVALVELHLNNKKTFKIMKEKLAGSQLMHLEKPQHFSALMYAFRRIASSHSQGALMQLHENFCASFMRWLPLMDAKMCYASLEALSQYCNKDSTYAFFEAFVRLCEFLENDRNCLTTAEIVHVLALYRTMYSSIRKTKCLWHRLFPLAHAHVSRMSAPQLTAMIECAHLAHSFGEIPSGYVLEVCDALAVRLEHSGNLISPRNLAGVFTAMAECNVGAHLERFGACVAQWDWEAGVPLGVCVRTLRAAAALDLYGAPWMRPLMQYCVHHAEEMVETPALAMDLLDTLVDLPYGKEALDALDRGGDETFGSLKNELMVVVHSRRAKELKDAKSGRAIFTLGDVLGAAGSALAYASADPIAREQFRSTGGFHMHYTDYYILPWAHPEYRIGVVFVSDRPVTASQRLQWRFWQRQGWRLLGVHKEDLRLVESANLRKGVTTLTSAEVQDGGERPSEDIRDKAVEDLERQIGRVVRVVSDERMWQWALGTESVQIAQE